MPFTELIRVTCDECPARLTGSNGRGPDAPGRYVELYEGHSQAIDAAVRQGWYVDARQTLCPAHWPGEGDDAVVDAMMREAPPAERGKV